jgi:peptide/nickel transport system permease protein
VLSYILRRLLIGLLTLLLITFVIYGLIRAMPGSPVTAAVAMLDPGKQPSKLDLERMRKAFGLDRPWYVAYFQWLARLPQGDLGTSLSRKQPVGRLIREHIGPTLLLSVPSILLAYGLSIPLGLRATVRSGQVEERILSTVLYMLYSLPSFVAALFLQILLAVKLGWLPLMLMTSSDYDSLSTWEKTWDIFKHTLLPVFCFTYGSLAFDTRFIKANMEEVIRQDFIRTARSKGVPPLRIVVHHAFRNTLIPLVTLLGLTLPGLFSGAVILERIFSWPGMGNLFFEAITERDYPTIMGLTLMFSVLTLTGQLLADILYAVVDPRVSYS